MINNKIKKQFFVCFRFLVYIVLFLCFFIVLFTDKVMKQQQQPQTLPSSPDKLMLNTSQQQQQSLQTPTSTTNSSSSGKNDKKITRFFKVPGSYFKTKDDVIRAFGFTLDKKLGQGAFSTVYLANDNRKKNKVACKTIDLGNSANKSRSSTTSTTSSSTSNSTTGSQNSKETTTLEDMRNELIVLEQVRHPYVVKLLCHFVVEQQNCYNLYLFMELADGGDLLKYFKKRGVPSEVECTKYFAQIVCGIGHMHSLGIAHRDIKMGNVLLVSYPRSITGDYLLRVSDFGLSKQVKVEQRNVEMSESICGTPVYMAPELMLGKPYDAYLVDVWALGITLHEMLTLEIPFDFDKSDNDVLVDMLSQKWRWSSKLKEPASAALNDLMNGMLHPTTSKRLRLVKVMAHRWLVADYHAAHDLSDQIKAEESQKNSKQHQKQQSESTGSSRLREQQQPKQKDLI